jgi:hypothetical protein
MHSYFEVSAALAQASVAGELRLQAALARTQFACLDAEGGLKAIVLSLQIDQSCLSLRELIIDERSVFIELSARLGHFLGALLQQSIQQLANKLRELVTQALATLLRPRFLFFELT